MNTIHIDGYPLRRWGNGRYIPNDLRDEHGRRLVIIDPREVERRLKARRYKEDEDA